MEDPDTSAPPPVMGDTGDSRPSEEEQITVVDGVSDPAAAGQPHFKPLNTVPAVIAPILSNVVMIILVFLLPILCDGKHNSPTATLSDKLDIDNLCPMEPFSILVYTHAVHWIIHLISDQFLKQKHRRSRCAGYMNFYLQTVTVYFANSMFRKFKDSFDIQYLTFLLGPF